MKKNKQLSIWMDYSNALLMELYNHKIISRRIAVKPPEKNKIKVDTPEVTILTKEQKNKQLKYFKEISDIVINYQEVLLFGPTEAKNDLLALLKEDYHYKNIIFELMNTNKMKEAKIHDFVIEHFN
ncbi:MAG: hypothetical protein PHS59_17660 [Paludibacter sp.]|nr:hypothetical protein [Paludibacter sp.]